MSTAQRRTLGKLTAVALSLALGGCVSSSIQTDVRRVHELTRPRHIPDVANTDVDPAAAEDARRILREPLDADAAVRVALLNNRELRAVLREMGVARGQLIQAGLLPNPVVEAELLPERNTELELRVEYDVTHALLTPMRSRAFEPELEAARYRAADAVVDLGFRVRTAFYGLQAAVARLSLAQHVLDALAAGRDAARALVEAGNIRELDLATHVAAYERARVTVAKLELEVVSERERVQRLLGTHGNDTTWRIDSGLSDVPDDDSVPPRLESRVLQANLDLLEMKHRLEGLARRAGYTRTAGWIPDLSLDLHALNGNPESDDASGRQWRYGGGLSVEVPLFDRNQGTTTMLEAEFDALLERYYGAAIELRSVARETRSRAASARARAHQYQTVIVPAQRQVTEQTLLQYNAMQIGVFQLLDARREQLDVELAYIDTLREYWTAAAALDALLAGHRVQSSDAEPTTTVASTNNNGERH